MTDRKVTNKQILEAIHTIGPYQTKIAVALGVSRTAIHKRILKSAELQEAFEDERESWVDLAESVIKKALDHDSLKAATFVARTLGKNRGYVMRDEKTGKDGQPLQTLSIGPNLDEMSGEQLDAYLDGLLQAAEAVHSTGN